MDHQFVVVKDETSVYHECSACKMRVFPEDNGLDTGDCLGFCCFECEQAMMEEEIRVAEAAQEEAATSVWK